MNTQKLWHLARLTSVVLAISAVTATELTEADKRAGLVELDRTRSALLAATKGLSEDQWKFKPGPDRWSIAEVLEHIVVTEGFLLENTTQKVMQAPAGKPDRDYKSMDTLVLNAISDRSHKAQAPPPVQPNGRWSPQESLDRFVKAREKTVEFLKSTAGLRDHVAQSPLGQPLDAYEWVLYISAHSDRHTKQILEVKADPNFPKQ